MMQFPIEGMGMDQLTQRVTPRGMRAVPKPLYSTQTYPAAGVETLTFFTTAAQQGRFLTNMDQAGQLPNPEFFIAWWMTLDILGAEPDNVPLLRDVYRVLFGTGTGGAPYALLRYNSQEWGPWMVSSMASSGGPTGFTTRTATEYANSGVPGHGGIYLGGALTLAPLKAFSLDLRWSAQAAVTNPLQLRVGLHGVHYYQIT